MRGRHTDLVSIYVPAGYNINEIRNLVFNEAATAENIKSRTTRKNVTTALERAGQKLKNYKVTPENGLIILCEMFLKTKDRQTCASGKSFRQNR